MNAVQRKFLIEKIQQKVKDKISELEKTLLEYPSASNYIFKSCLNNELELQSPEIIKEAIKKKALAAKEGSNWLSEDRMGWNKENTIKLLINELIVLPNDYKVELERVMIENRKIKEEIKSLKIQLDTIEVRIQLASDKTLQTLINEVDDMGNLSLIDTKIKLLN
jgi:hypothetical protein